jgi:hypothetical protein
MNRILPLLLLCSVPGFSQLFSAGIRGGVPLTDFVNTVESGRTSYFTHTNRYIIGPTAELHLPFGFGIEVDALYRHVNYQSNSMGVDTFSTSSATANAFEFPLLVKYRFGTKVVHPFVDAGYAFDTLQGLTETITNHAISGNLTSTRSTSDPSELQHKTTRGIVFGGGLNIRLLVVHIIPEIRYTHWNQEHFTVSGLIHSNTNQGEFLLGITF